MKALSLYQPYASLIAIEEKLIETRSWPTRYRGRFAVHASAKMPQGLQHLCFQKPFRDILARHGFIKLNEAYVGDHKFPLGAIIATVELVDCVPTNDITSWQFGWQIGRKTWCLTDQERAFGDYSPNRYAWLLDNVQMLPEPIPARGALGLWEWSEKV